MQQPLMLDSNPQPHQETSTRSSLRGVLIFIAALALTTNLLLFLGVRDFYTWDSPSYVAAASNLVQGHGFTDSNGDSEITRTPGYPLLIAPFLWVGVELKCLIVLQHLLLVLITLAAAAFAYQLSGSRRQAIITGILLCSDLPSLDAANSIMTEILFTATLIAIVWLLWTTARATEFMWQRVVLAGVLTGVSVLIRPITMYFYLPVVAYFLLTRKTFKLRASFCFVLAFACLPLAWAARNYARTGYFTISAISGWNMLGYRAAGVLAVNDPGDFSLNLEKRQLQLLGEVCKDTKGLGDANCLPLTVPQKSIPQKSEAYMKVGRKIVLQHPAAYAKIAVRGAALMMFGGDAYLVMTITGLGPRLAKGLILIYTVPLYCLAMVGTYSFWNQERYFFYLALLVVGYFVIISTGAEAYSRMRVPIMPIYAILIAAGADSILRRFRNPKHSVINNCACS